MLSPQLYHTEKQHTRIVVGYRQGHWCRTN